MHEPTPLLRLMNRARGASFTMKSPRHGKLKDAYFGKTHGGKIYQKLWFSVPLANMVGTNIVSRRKDAAYNDAAADLAAGIDESAFTAAFGAPKAELGSLLVRRTIRC